MASIRHRNGRFTASIRKAGFPAISQTFSTRKKAEAWARRTETGIEDGSFQVDRKHSLADAIDRFGKGRELSKYQNGILDWWRISAQNYDEIPLGSKKLQYLRRSDFIEAREQLQEMESRNGEPLAPATINRRLSQISAVLTAAMEWDWLDNNPARIKSIPEKNERTRLLDENEVKRLLKACQASEEPDLHTFVVCAMLSGARAGELQGLRWRGVDLEKGVGRLMDTKNDENRAIPIRGKALELLRELRKSRAVVDLNRDDFVFRNKTGFAPFYYRKAWGEAREGIPDLRFHDLRHLAASHLAMSGATHREVQEILGHKSAQMTKRYSHFFDSHVAELGDRLNQRLFGSNERED